jgi:hypothetical protein
MPPKKEPIYVPFNKNAKKPPTVYKSGNTSMYKTPDEIAAELSRQMKRLTVNKDSRRAPSAHPPPRPSAPKPKQGGSLFKPKAKPKAKPKPKPKPKGKNKK